MTCADWLPVLIGAQVAAHETMHLLGWRDEGVAQCYGMQGLAYWVYKLSGDAAFAKEASLDYWADYQASPAGPRTVTRIATKAGRSMGRPPTASSARELRRPRVNG